jgi:hypothetical protein
LENNIVTNAWILVGVNGSAVTFGTLDYNAYGNANSGTQWYVNGTGDIATLAAWKTASGEGPHSTYTASGVSLNSDYTPQAASPAVGAGANLTSLCSGNLTALCSDLKGVARPATGAWDAGAYQYAQTRIGKIRSEILNAVRSPAMFPNPIQLVLLKRYLDINKNARVYDLTGNPVEKHLLRNQSVYVVQVNTSRVRQKVVVTK